MYFSEPTSTGPILFPLLKTTSIYPMNGVSTWAKADFNKICISLTILVKSDLLFEKAKETQKM